MTSWCLHICHTEQNPMQTACFIGLFLFLVGLSQVWKAERMRTTSLKWYLVNLFAVSFQGPWVKHLVKWPTPFQSLNLQERWRHQKMRRRKRPWRPCSPVWPHSAARGCPAGPPGSFAARLPEAGPLLWSSHHFMYLLHYISEWDTAFWEGSLLISLHSLQRFWDLNGIALERRGYKCIVFRGIHRSIVWGGGQRSLSSRNASFSGI